MVKPMPGNPMAPGLAQSWSVSADGLLYEFVLRRGVKFHNGDPVTAEDVQFSFERYRGAAAKPLKEAVAAVETPDPGRVRFRLKRPWADFMTFYVNATGASWIVPKKYTEKVGDEGFKRAPIGTGPYKFAAFTPGVELVLEAFDQYNGFDAGDYFCDAALANIGEPVVNNLHAVGIRAKLRPLERAAFFKGYAEKKYKGLIQGGSGAYGNAATRIEAFVAAGGPYVYGSYPDIDGLFREQAAELDPKRRETILFRIQQLIHDKVLVAPIWLNAGLSGVGPKVEESGIGLIAGYAFSAPYEDVKLKGK